jgi:hypothetical protein
MKMAVKEVREILIQRFIMITLSNLGMSWILPK